MNYWKSVIYFLSTLCFVNSSKLMKSLKNQQENSAFLKKTAEVQLVYYGSNQSLLWRFEKIANWYKYKMHYLENNTSEVESKLRNYLNSLSGETVIMLLNR